uniref:Aldedh domain-containing protein n=1 Tax=Angiostrongylus cantonensis TaxID=6313 RepID=A0A0K0DC83_ANGCA
MRAFNTTSTFMHLVDWQKACYDNSLRFHTLEQIVPLDSEEYLKQGVEANVGKGPYFFSGTKVGSTLRVKTWANNPSLAFDPPDKRNKLKQAFFDCCPPTWEFEDFVFSTDWSANPFISYQKYTLHKSSKSICSAELESGQTVPYQSFLIEVGKRYNARPIGVEFKELDPIRINFLIGHQAIEMAYAFSSVTAPGITDLMQLDKYDGKDPSKLEINVVKAPYCEARLLNDMAAVNVQRGIEAGSQCLSISSCTCLE